MKTQLKRMVGLTFVAFLALTPYAAAQLPSRDHTPGAAVKVDMKKLCSPTFVPDAKQITNWQRDEALSRYGIRPDRFDGVLEHLVPVSLGGTNDPDNLYPFHAQGTLTLEAKSELADRVRELVCEGSLSLKAAQNLFKKDWTKAYREYVQQLRNVGGD